MQSIGLTQPNGQSPSPRLLSPLLAGGLRGGRTEGVWEGHPCPDNLIRKHSAKKIQRKVAKVQGREAKKENPCVFVPLRPCVTFL